MTSHDIHDTRNCTKPRRARRWGRRALLALGITLGLGGVAYAAGPAGFHHPRTPEEVQAHMDKMIDHMIEQVKGSEEQRAAIKAIVDELAGGLPDQQLLFVQAGIDEKVVNTTKSGHNPPW